MNYNEIINEMEEKAYILQAEMMKLLETELNILKQETYKKLKYNGGKNES